MKAPHEMAEWERRETVQRWLDDALAMVRMYRNIARFSGRHPERAGEFTRLADGWQREVDRLAALRILH